MAEEGHGGAVVRARLLHKISVTATLIDPS